MEIYVSINIGPLRIFKDLFRPPDKFHDQPPLVSSPGQSPFARVLISPIAPIQCGAFVWITFKWEPLLCTNYHLNPKWRSCQPIYGCNCWKYCSIWAFSEGDVQNYSGVTRCHLNSDTLCSWEQWSYPEMTWTLLKTIKAKENRAFLRIIRRKSVLTASRIMVELIRRTGRCGPVRTAQKCSVATDQEAICDICLDVLKDIRLLLDVPKLYG